MKAVDILGYLSPVLKGLSKFKIILIEFSPQFYYLNFKTRVTHSILKIGKTSYGGF